MGLFDFTFSLSSVILGLALTHIASTTHKLLLAGWHVRWAPEPILLATIVLLVIVSVWMFSWSDRQMATVTIGLMLLQVGKLLTLYIAAASCLPEPKETEVVDLRAYYEKTRLLSFGSLIASLLLFRIYQIATHGWPSPVTLDVIVGMALFPILYASLLFVRRRWFNVSVLLFIVVYYGWNIVAQHLSA